MSGCDPVRADLDAYRDGALDSARAREVRLHLRACRGCAAELERAASIERGLRATAAGWRPPAGLWSRIRASVDALERDGAPAVRAPRGRPYRAAAAGLALAVVAVAGGAHLLGRGGDAPADTLASALVNEFHTFVISRRALDFPSASPGTVRGWFSDKVDFRPPMPAAAPGLRLAGGRLCNILDQRVASYMYESGDAWISLYIMKSDVPASARLDGGAGTVSGYGYVGWSSGGLRYSLVGDVPGHELRRIAERLRAGAVSAASGRDAAPAAPSRARRPAIRAISA